MGGPAQEVSPMAKRTRTALRPRTWRPPRDRGLVDAFADPASPKGLRVLVVPGLGPEDVAVDDLGRLITGTDDGRIWRLDPETGDAEQIADTAGRPLGIEWHPEGWLVVCDAERGLLRVDPNSGDVVGLVLDVGGEPLQFTNNAAIAGDGRVYFTDSSRRFGIGEFKGDLLAHTSSGRLLRWTPPSPGLTSDRVEVLLDGLDFANGVALAADDSYVLVAETGGYRIRRLDLTGATAGASRVIVDNMPGLPDNMSRGLDDVFWIAMPSTRNRLLDALLPRPGLLRSLVWALPDAVQPDADRVLWVVGINGHGRVVHQVFQRDAGYHYVTGVREVEGRLYLGSLAESAIGVIDSKG
jgi:sugar lactone lactonase YvrE